MHRTSYNGKNILMSSFFIHLKKMFGYAAYPMIFVSSFLILLNTLALLPVEAIGQSAQFFRDAVKLLFGTAIVGFSVLYSTSNAKKAVAAAFCASASNLVFYSLSGQYYSLLFLTLLAFFASLILQKLDLLYAYFVLVLSGLVFSLVFGMLYDELLGVLRVFASALKNKPSLFGVVNNFYTIAFSDRFADLFYHSDYSQSLLIDGRIYSGAADLFAASKKAPPSVTAEYLTGKYYVTVFVNAGLFFALYNKFNDKEKAAYALVSALCLLFGRFEFLFLMLMLYNPFVYFSSLLLIFVSYLLPRLLDIRIGFTDNGTLFELIAYSDKTLYFLLSGLVLSVLSYFVVLLTLSKFDIQRHKYLPRDVKKIVSALGGSKNIEKIRDDVVFVKNPNLIDILRLDCDIKENAVLLHTDETNLLKEYF